MIEKAVVIGWDAPIIKSVKKYVEKGYMPNVKQLIDNGIWVENCLVPHPTITPPNWTTIATGAWPGTHGIICFNLLEQKTLEKSYEAFFKDDCKAEYIWESASKAGAKTILLNYPSTWPQAIKNGIQIGGAGLAINEYRTESKFNLPIIYSLGGDLLFSTEKILQSILIKTENVKEWKNLPKGKEFLEAKIEITLTYSKEICKEKPWHLLLINSGNGYDKVEIYREKDGKKPIATVTKGNWSSNIYQKILTDKGEKRIVFKVKLLDISPDGASLKIYFSPLCNLEGFGFPSGIEKELESMEGLPIPNTFYTSQALGWIDMDTLSELIDFQNIWLGEAAKYLLKNKEWTLFFMHAHCPDHFYHRFINDLEPLNNKDKINRNEIEKEERNLYISLDKMVGEIMKVIDVEKTLVIITSDHGAVPTANITHPEYKGFSVNDILKAKGLLIITQDKNTREEKIVWNKTKAIGKLSSYIFINLKGKYPTGIVEENDYHDVQDEIIKALYDYTDPISGKKPIAFAFKKQDARLIGLYGDNIGDVVYGVYPEVSGEHGRQISTGEYGIGSMKGLFIANGPEIKKGVVLKRTIHLTDIVPTLCFALDLPVPKDCEGAIIYQLFNDPDFKINETKKIKEDYKKMKKAIESNKFLTHNY